MSEDGDRIAQQAVSDVATLLSQARAESEQLLAAARAEAAAMRASAQQEAEAIIADAERQAAILYERGRQEFFWRRRQLRQQHDLLARWKSAMESQLASVSTFAVRTARDLYEVRESPAADDLSAAIGTADAIQELARST